MLLQRSQPESTREQNLSSYAGHLQQLSSHLDARAEALQSAEARLATSQSDLSTHRHALTELETRTRLHIAELLRHIHQRQAALVSWEHTAASAKKSLSKNLAAADVLLSDATNAATHLNQLRAEHHHLQASLSQRRAQLTEIETQVEAATRSHDTLKSSVQTIVNDKEAIQRAADRLQSLDATLRSRQTKLDAREQTINQRQARLQRFKPLEIIFVPLQAFLDQAAAATLIDRVSLDTDMTAAVDAAVVAMRELRTATQDVQAARADVNNTRKHLFERESRLKSGESDLRNKRHMLDREKSALQRRISEVSTTQTEVSEAWGAIQEARKETDAREEQLRAREAALEHAESRIQHREAAFTEREKTLSRRERSLRRAHAAVTARERAIAAREREMEIERTRLNDLSKAVGLREDMLETRDLELSARESDRGGRLEALLQRSLEHPSSADRTRPESTARPVTRTQEMREGDTEERNISEASPDCDIIGAAPSTVRRQLAFFESTKEAAENPDEVATGKRTTDDHGIPDDESETAAEQLLPELVGARSYWRERVERLERIVQGMRDKTWAVKPHVLPVLTSVSEGLLAIRREINECPRPSGNGSPKNAYVNEQACQIRWREQMKQHFDSVREIQAGLLIRLNREEDVAESAAVESSDPRGQESANTSNTAESSVDATLDVTFTGDITRDILRTGTEESRDVSSSLQHPRLQIGTEGLTNRLSPMLDFSASHWGDAISHVEAVGRPLSQGTAQEEEVYQLAEVTSEQDEDLPLRAGQTGAPPGNIDVTPEDADVRQEDVLQELALLRDDLENVTVSQGPELS